MASYLEAEGRAILERLNDEHDKLAISVDTETTGLRIADGIDHGIGVSIAGLFEDDTPYSHYYGLDHETGENVSVDTAMMLDWVLTTAGHTLVFANVQFDILSLESMGISVEDYDFVDVCTMAHLVNENWPKNKGVESLSQYYLHEPGKIVDPFIESEKRSGNQLVTPEQMFDYATMDAVTTWRIWDLLDEHPRWKALPTNIWPDKQELVRCLLTMKRRGVRIDVELAQQEITTGESELRRLAAELGYPAIIPKEGTAAWKRNPNPLPTLGPIALTEIFIDRLGLPPMKVSTKTGKPSFDKEVMGEYDEMLERVDSKEAMLVKQYRGWQKTVSAAYRPYLELLGPDGRLRCSYKTHGTVTGRLSCSEPNLQQIPKESDKVWNGKVKECFIAAEGYTLLNSDFSQLELRLGTAYAGEPALIEVFEEGRDIFTEMSVALGFTRQNTKTFVYSIQYGAGVNRIKNVFGVTKEQAQRMIRNYYSTYPLFKVLSERCSANAEARGEIKLWNGRYRHFEYKSDSYKAMNSLIQGGAADIMERVMVRCFRELDNDDCRMLLQVHDSITWEVRTDRVDEYLPKIKAMMEDVSGAVGHDEFIVKFAVDAGFWTDKEAAKHDSVN